MKTYINFYFENLKTNWSEATITGTFKSPDDQVYCDFVYHVGDDTFEISNNNKPAEEILPLPIWWLYKKYEENGYIKDKECRICY